jgi:1,4-alpha-glucan branching enzyme
LYKYHIRSTQKQYQVDKTDPFAFFTELSPQTASVTWDLAHEWSDDTWMENRSNGNMKSSPMTVYEMHLGSWIRIPEEKNRFPTYRELAEKLPDYLLKMGFTHVEFLPVMEHPFYGSWGYQCLGYFAPSSRFGSPQDFMVLVDRLHQKGIGVILDWVPSHFPSDEHGLGYFDGTHLFEHEDPRKGFHPDWKSLIFNYGRNEVVSYLISSARFWLEKYHMLTVSGWMRLPRCCIWTIPEKRVSGSPTDTGAGKIWKRLPFSSGSTRRFMKPPPAVTIAEESTDWPMVSRPSHLGGLGFDMKWDMGWMHDTLAYMSMDPIHRSFHHDKLTFRMIYAFNENYVLPLSHDEVVHGKGSLLGKMSGDEWQKFAGLRLLFGYMYAQPAKKLDFHGGEIGQSREWNHDRSLDWHLLENPFNKGLQRWIEDLNQFYRHTPAMHADDFSRQGFQWIDCNDVQQSTLTFLRKGRDRKARLLLLCVILHPYPVPITGWGFLADGFWKECLNSDAKEYGGSNQGSLGQIEASPVPAHGFPFP